MKRIITILILMMLSCSLLISCGGNSSGGGEAEKTDEEKIEARIEAFLTAYNDGDLDKVLESFDAKTKKTFESAFGLIEGIGLGGSVGGLDISGNLDFSDLFGFSVGMLGEEELLDVSINTIQIRDSEPRTAKVGVFMTFDGFAVGEEGGAVVFSMVYENGDWFIKDLEEGRLENVPSNENSDDNASTPDANVLVNAVSINKFSPNHSQYGYTLISYSKGNDNYVGFANANGKIVFDTEGSLSGFSRWGCKIWENDTAYLYMNGTGFFVDLKTGKYNICDSKYVDFYDVGGGVGYLKDQDGGFTLVNTKGEIVNPVPYTFDDIRACGDGYAWVYKYVSTITTIEHQYGLIDKEGNWLFSLAPLDRAYLDGSYDVSYCNEGMFAIDGEDYVQIYDVALGEWVCAIEAGELNIRFINGVAAVKTGYWYDEVYNYYFSDPVLMKDDYLLYKDGTTQKIGDFSDLGNGYIMFERDYYKTFMNIGDLSTYQYTEYSAHMVQNVEFVGNVGIVTLEGVDRTSYFTVIDTQGNQKIDPVTYSDLKLCDGGIIVYKNPQTQKYIIMDGNGAVLASELNYSQIYEFSNGVAMAIDENSKYILINTRGEKIS